MLSTRPGASGDPDHLDLPCPKAALRHAVPDGLALFDYHADNLMMLPGRGGIAAMAIGLTVPNYIRNAAVAARER